MREPPSLPRHLDIPRDLADEKARQAEIAEFMAKKGVTKIEAKNDSKPSIRHPERQPEPDRSDAVSETAPEKLPPRSKFNRERPEVSRRITTPKSHDRDAEEAAMAAWLAEHNVTKGATPEYKPIPRHRHWEPEPKLDDLQLLAKVNAQVVESEPKLDETQLLATVDAEIAKVRSTKAKVRKLKPKIEQVESDDDGPLDEVEQPIRDDIDPDDPLAMVPEYPSGVWRARTVGEKQVLVDGHAAIGFYKVGPRSSNYKYNPEFDEPAVDATVHVTAAASSYDKAACKFLLHYRNLGNHYLELVASGKTRSEQIPPYLAQAILEFRDALRKARGLATREVVRHRRPGHKLSLDQVKEVLTRLEQGEKPADIARIVGCTAAGVTYIRNRNGGIDVEDLDYRVCRTCDKRKSITEFYPSPKWHCKKCVNAENKRRHHRAHLKFLQEHPELRRQKVAKKTALSRRNSRICRGECQTRKPLDEFYKGRAVCKACLRTEARKYHWVVRRNIAEDELPPDIDLSRAEKMDAKFAKILAACERIVAAGETATKKAVSKLTKIPIDGLGIYWSRPEIVTARTPLVSIRERIRRAVEELKQENPFAVVIKQADVAERSGLNQRRVRRHWHEVTDLLPTAKERIKSAILELKAKGVAISQVALVDNYLLNSATVSKHWADPEIAALHGMPITKGQGRGNYYRGPKVMEVAHA